MGSLNIANVITKSIGVAGLGLIAYDAHCAGKITGPMREKEHKAENLEGQFFNGMNLDSNSAVKAETKKRIFKYFLDENVSGFFTTTAGYLDGFATNLVSNVVPLGLAVGTVLTKGKVSKCFGAGLLAYGGIFLLQEMFGIGKPKE